MSGNGPCIAFYLSHYEDRTSLDSIESWRGEVKALVPQSGIDTILVRRTVDNVLKPKPRRVGTRVDVE